MAQVSWDELFAGPAGGPAAEPPPPPVGAFAFVRSTEAWLTLLLVLFVLFPVVASLESADWVREMPSLAAAGVIGVLTGWLLAHQRRPGVLLAAAGAASGVAVVVGMVMHTMRLADPLLGTGVRARWSELWLRLRDWAQAALDGDASGDALPFVLLLVMLVWGVGFLSSWSVVRWRNAWAALIALGVVLLTNISYLPGQPAFAFILFLFGAVLLVARMQFMQALRGWQRQRLSLPDYMSLEVLFAGAWVGLALVVFAWAIPTANEWGPIADRWISTLQPLNDRVDRLGRLFVGVGSKKDLPAHAFGDVFPLQGRIALDGTVLFEAVAAEPGNLRGAVYDEYTGAGWRVSEAGSVPLEGTTVEAAEFGTPLSRAQVRTPVAVEITVVGDMPDRRLLSVGSPIAADAEADLLLDGAGDAIGLVPGQRVREGDTYQTVGTVSAAAARTLAATGRDYPAAIVARYTQLPEGLPPEIAELARSIVGETDRPYDAARRVESYLRDQYPFSLTIADPPPRRDVVAYFLFDSQAGYFDFHASAMAVLLRTLGVPTRVATGFALDEADLDRETKTFRVTERRAWAWPEVYFAGLGWVEFNPTPGRPLVARPDDDSDLVQRRTDFDAEELARLFEEQLLEEIEAIEAPGSISTPTAREEESRLGAVVVAAVTWIVGAALALLVAGVAGRVLWEYEFRGLEPAVRRWAKVQRLATWAGRSGAAMRTPLEFARELPVTGSDRDAGEALARAYTRSRYGGRPPTEEDEERARTLDDAYRAVRRALWGVILRRLVPLPRRGGGLAGRHGPAAAGREAL